MYKYSFFLIALIFLISCQTKVQKSDAYGNFEATSTTISSEANGKLLYFNVEEGQKLKAGQAVALVDTIQLHLQRKQLEAGLATLPKKLRNTLAEIEVLKNQISNLKRERDRVERLVAKKAATRKQLDDMNGQLDVLEKKIAAIKSNTQTGNAAILSEKEPILAKIDLLNEQIRRCYITNPVNGTVITKLAESFEIVRMGAPLYRIGQLDEMTLRFYVDAVQLQELKIGSKIQVLVDKGENYFREFEGSITWISDEAEFTPKTIQTKEDRVNLVYAVKAKVNNPDGLLKMGMPAEINFTKKTIETEE